MVEYFVLYIFSCLIVAILGRNRKLGFLGYLCFSIVFTPVAGLIVVQASEYRGGGRRDRAAREDMGAVVRFGFREAERHYRERINRLIVRGAISPSFAERRLEPLLERLRETIRFESDGRPHCPLDPILEALEQLPPSSR